MDQQATEDFTGYCPQCGSIHIRVTDKTLTDNRAIETWTCPQCGHSLETRRELSILETVEVSHRKIRRLVSGLGRADE